MITDISLLNVFDEVNVIHVFKHACQYVDLKRSSSRNRQAGKLSLRYPKIFHVSVYHLSYVKWENFLSQFTDYVFCEYLLWDRLRAEC